VLRWIGSASSRKLALAGLTLACTLGIAVPAAAQTGGTPTPGSTEPTPTPAPTGPPGRATLLPDGTAVAPANAPPAVQAAIYAGNEIRTRPYKWGGGHRSFYDSGYDCSGAVSYLLHAAGFLTSPMTSGGLATSWGILGKGWWITVFANPSHAYMKVAGLRFDTSSNGEKLNQGSGPRWRATKRKPRGYSIKHFPAY
jgi:hypothetical protein